jgi:hypothetical protein
MSGILEEIGPRVARRNPGELRNLATDRGYDAIAFHGKLRDNGIRPLSTTGS